VVEPHHPDRVLRQFGRVQIIPRSPLEPLRATRAAHATKYQVHHKLADQTWEEWEDHLLAERNRSTPVVHPSDAVREYMEWFNTITHPRVQNPRFASTFAPRARDLHLHEVSLIIFFNIFSIDFDCNLINIVYLTQRILSALRITEPIVQRGADEGSSMDTAYLYRAIDRVNTVLHGQHIEQEEDETMQIVLSDVRQKKKRR